MPSERVFIYWGLLLMAVPLAASSLGGGWSRTERFFLGACVPLTFLLVAFVPRVEVPPALAVAATFAFSGLVMAVYLALSPQAVRTWRGLLAVLCVMNLAALGAIRLSLLADLGFPALAGLLVGTTALAGAGAVWVARHALGTRHVDTH